MKKKSEKREKIIRYVMAHNQHMDAYKKWGADLILSGHLHGGLVRCPGIGAVVTPQGFLFPKYSGEMRREGEQTMIEAEGPEVIRSIFVCLICRRLSQSRSVSGNKAAS